MTRLTGTATFVRRYLDAHHPLDALTVDACRHPDFERHCPQTTASSVFAPRNPVWQLTGRDDVWIAQGAGTTVEGEPCHVVTVIELRSGLVRRETSWLAPTLPRPPSRADVSELTEWRPAGDMVEVAVTDDVVAARRRAIAAYFRNLSKDPVAAHEAFLHPDSVEIMPQSSERIRGRDRMLEALLSHPNFPTVAVRRAMVVGDTGLAEVSMREDDEDFFGIGVVRFRGAKAESLTEYWAPRLGADEWRSKWLQPADA